MGVGFYSETSFDNSFHQAIDTVENTTRYVCFNHDKNSKS